MVIKAEIYDQTMELLASSIILKFKLCNHTYDQMIEFETWYKALSHNERTTIRTTITNFCGKEISPLNADGILTSQIRRSIDSDRRDLEQIGHNIYTQYEAVSDKHKDNINYMFNFLQISSLKSTIIITTNIVLDDYNKGLIVK